MRVSKGARYALYAAMEMAVAGEGPVTASGTARRHGLPPDAVAKVYQRLVRAGIASGSRGVGGGYRLTRDPGDLTVQEIVALFDPPRAEGRCLLDPARADACPDLRDCRLRTLFDEVDELVRCTFASVTVATLVREPLAGSRRGAPGAGSP